MDLAAAEKSFMVVVAAATLRGVLGAVDWRSPGSRRSRRACKALRTRRMKTRSEQCGRPSLAQGDVARLACARSPTA